MQETETQSKFNKNLFIDAVVVFIILSALGLIYINSQLFPKRMTTVRDYNSGMISSVAGYDYDANDFVYNAGKDCYFTVTPGPGVKELLLFFSGHYDKDIPVGIIVSDANGKYYSAETTWKAGDPFVAIESHDLNAIEYRIYIPADFSLYKVYLAGDYHQDHSVKKIFVLADIALLIAVVGAYFIFANRLHPKKSIPAYVGCFLVNFAKKYKKQGAYVAASVVLATLIVFILSKLNITVSLDIIKVTDGLKENRTNTIGFNYKNIIVVTDIFLILGMIIFFKPETFKEKLEIPAMLLVLIIGGSYAVSEPVGSGVIWDDETHFRYIEMISTRMNDYTACSSDYLEINNALFVFRGDKMYTKEGSADFAALVDELEDRAYWFYTGDVDLIYRFAAYTPFAIPMIIGRGLGWSFSFMFIMGRLLNNFLMAAVLYFTIKNLKYGKLCTFLMLLTPTLAFMSGSYTYDTWVNYGIALGLSFYFAELQSGEKMKLSSMILIPIVIGIAIIPKIVYFPIIFLALFMPAYKFDGKKQMWLYRAWLMFTVFMAGVFVFISRFVKSGTGDVRGGSNVNATEQIQYIIHHPLDVMNTLTLFLKEYLNPLKTAEGYLDNMSYNGRLGITRIMLLLIIVICIISHETDLEHTFKIHHRIIFLLMYVCIGYIVAGTMYIAYTNVGADSVAGCQARYILPMIFPCVYVLTRIPVKTRLLDKIGQARLNKAAYLALAILNVYCVYIGAALRY